MKIAESFGNIILFPLLNSIRFVDYFRIETFTFLARIRKLKKEKEVKEPERSKGEIIQLRTREIGKEYIEAMRYTTAYFENKDKRNRKNKRIIYKRKYAIIESK